MSWPTPNFADQCMNRQMRTLQWPATTWKWRLERDDLEIEVDRFDLELGEALKKFEFEKRPRPPLEETLPIGVDAFSRLLGRTEDQSLEEATEKLLARILRSIFPEASLADIEQVFRERPSRVGLYS
eukprot:evm.model.scf_1256.1 EVM.evm.TU.scf_1256.1   scf_1256:9515-12531(+)